MCSLFVSNFRKLDQCWKKLILYDPDIVIFISIYNYTIYCYSTLISVLESSHRISEESLESSVSIYLKSLCQNHKQIIYVPAPPSFTTFSHLRELQIEKQIKSKQARNTSLQWKPSWKLIAFDNLMRVRTGKLRCRLVNTLRHYVLYCTLILWLRDIVHCIVLQEVEGRKSFSMEHNTAEWQGTQRLSLFLCLR